MTARHDDLTQMTANTGASPCASPGASPGAQALPAAAPSIARKRDALAARHNPDIARFCDEEVETIWGSLSETVRAAYLRG